LENLGIWRIEEFGELRNSENLGISQLSKLIHDSKVIKILQDGEELAFFSQSVQYHCKVYPNGATDGNHSREIPDPTEC
jgi:hypothetical protein